MSPGSIAAAEPSTAPLASAMPPQPGVASRWRALISWQAIAIAALLLLGELPLLLKFLADLWSRPQYQFFPVALIAAGYIFWERVREMPPEHLQRGSARITLGLLVLSWIVLAGGLLYLRWMAPVSSLILLAAAVWWIGGRRLAQTALPAGILLLITIPPPAHMDDAVANHLRLWAVHASSGVLDLLALPHLITGTVIEIPGHRLLVEEACSGINSLLSVMAFTVLYGIWQQRRAWFTAVLTVAAAGFVLCGNIARITFGAILVHFWKIDILTGTGHELLGMALFAVCLGLVISFDRFLLLLWPNQERANEPLDLAPKPHVAPRPTALKSGLLWWPAAIAFLVLGVALQTRLGHLWAQSRLPENAKFSLPTKLAGWELIRGDGTVNGRPETDGAKSNFWIYRSGPLKAAVALDYPFIGFHDATICYSSSGWAINSKAQLAPSNQPQNGYFQIEMTKTPMMQGQLLFAQFDEHGIAPPVTPQIPPNVGGVQLALTLSRQKALAPPTYQVQTLSIGYAPASPREEASLRALFLAARAELSRQVAGQLEQGR